MADEIATLKQLQAGLNASFEAVYAAKDAASLAKAKEGLIGLGHATAGVAMGPAFSIVSMAATPLHYMATRIAIDLNVFEIIAERPHTLTELSEKTKADPKLVRRILRVVTALGYLHQDEFDTWKASPLTQFLAMPPLRDFLIVHFDKRMTIADEYPEWLRKHDYQTSWASSDDNVAKQVYGTDVWSFYEQHPAVARQFESAMSLQEQFPPEMTPPYPFVDGFDGIKTDVGAVTLVDVGGGRGQAIRGLKNAYPEIPGRLILQDLAMTADKLDPEEAKKAGFEVMAHNFFEPQPVKGAKYYHMRRVLHDWNDEHCIKILKATRPAMDLDYSRLLICDFVLPNVSPGPVETFADLMMMSVCDGAERAEQEWRELLGEAGFKIEKIWRPDAGTTCVIEAVVA